MKLPLLPALFLLFVAPVALRATGDDITVPLATDERGEKFPASATEKIYKLTDEQSDWGGAVQVKLRYWVADTKSRLVVTIVPEDPQDGIWWRRIIPRQTGWNEEILSLENGSLVPSPANGRTLPKRFEKISALKFFNIWGNDDSWGISSPSEGVWVIHSVTLPLPRG